MFLVFGSNLGRQPLRATTVTSGNFCRIYHEVYILKTCRICLCSLSFRMCNLAISMRNSVSTFFIVFVKLCMNVQVDIVQISHDLLHEPPASPSLFTTITGNGGYQFPNKHRVFWSILYVPFRSSSSWTLRARAYRSNSGKTRTGCQKPYRKEQREHKYFQVRSNADHIYRMWEWIMHEQALVALRNGPLEGQHNRGGGHLFS